MAAIGVCRLPGDGRSTDSSHMVIRVGEARSSRVSAVALLGGGAAASWLVHAVVPPVGTLTAAVALGIVIGNCWPQIADGSQVSRTTKRMLRVGVVLLGYSLSVATLAALGWPLVLLVASAVAITLVATAWLGLHLGLSSSRSLLLATGFSICGASAIAAVEEQADATEDEVASAVGMVTLFGTAAMLAFPALGHLLGLTDQAYGVWAGASVHEVGQVVGAASGAGASVLALAVSVKLTRVLMLAPVVIAVSAYRRSTGANGDPTTLPPIVPLFVVGFLMFVALRSSGWIPDACTPLITVVQQASLAAAMFGMGLSARMSSLLRGGWVSIVVCAASTALITSLGLALALAST